MPIRLSCSCGKALRVKDQDAGKRVKCPVCKTSIAVPERDGESASTPQQNGIAFVQIKRIGKNSADALHMSVVVDGKEVALLKSGKTLSLEVASCTPHTIDVRWEVTSTSIVSSAYAVTLETGATATFECEWQHSQSFFGGPSTIQLNWTSRPSKKSVRKAAPQKLYPTAASSVNHAKPVHLETLERASAKHGTCSICAASSKGQHYAFWVGKIENVTTRSVTHRQTQSTTTYSNLHKEEQFVCFNCALAHARTQRRMEWVGLLLMLPLICASIVAGDAYYIYTRIEEADFSVDLITEGIALIAGLTVPLWLWLGIVHYRSPLAISVGEMEKLVMDRRKLAVRQERKWSWSEAQFWTNSEYPFHHSNQAYKL